MVPDGASVDRRSSVTAIVRNPPFTFVPTFLEQADILRMEEAKKRKFDLVHNLKVTKQQQQGYAANLATALKRNSQLRKERDAGDTSFLMSM